ncbi:MAG: hypothetical protein GWO24_12055, partial [Akkermansiaceae bacterium]|nr:hypothetical protein [Akkermansiaceae bacterium]
MAAVLLAVAAAVASTRLLLPGASNGPTPVDPTPSVRFILPSSSNQYRQAGIPVISPDGKRVVFPATSLEDNKRRLWVRELDEFGARPLSQTDQLLHEFPQTFWCEDSQRLAYHADGKLWSIGLDETGREIVASIPDNFGATWNREGVIILAPGTGGLVRIPASGGKPELITRPDPGISEVGHVEPHFLPDGNRFLFRGLAYDPAVELTRRHLYAGRLDSPEITIVTPMNSSVWFVEPGTLVYVEGGSIKAAPFDASELRLTGKARSVTDRVSYFQPSGMSTLSVARNGNLVFTSPMTDEELVWVEGSGMRLPAIAGSHSFLEVVPDPDTANFRLSPDGKRVVGGVSDLRTGLADIWLFDLERKTQRRLT